MSCGFEYDDGAYVLGALSPEDRAAFERHLPDCDACSRSVGELAGLPGLLARVPVDVLESPHEPVPVPDTLLPSLVQRVRRDRRRRTWASAGLVAAAVIVAGVAVGVTVSTTDDNPGSTVVLPAPSTSASPLPFVPVGAQPISGWVSFTKVGWGTRLDVTCSYAEAQTAYQADAGTAYTMVVTRTDGKTEQVASWNALPGHTMHLSAATSASIADIARVDVRTANGTEVLRLVNG